MSARRHVSSGSSYERDIGFSRAVRVGSHIYVSATAAIWPDGHVDDDVALQAERSWRSSGPRSETRARAWRTWCGRASTSWTPPTGLRSAPCTDACSAKPGPPAASSSSRASLIRGGGSRSRPMPWWTNPRIEERDQPSAASRTSVTASPAVRSRSTCSVSAPVFVISSWALSMPAICANATRPSFVASATTTVRLARPSARGWSAPRPRGS